MNQANRNLLIDENEIRATLKPLRPDALAFNSGVRSRIKAESSKVQNAPRASATEVSDRQQSEWLRIAASFLPISLLGRNLDSTIVPISFAAISLGKKLVVVLAFPFLCIFMIGLTLYGLLRIRTAQNLQGAADFNIEQAHRVMFQWWKHYGWIAAIVFVGTLAAPILGWTTPLMLALVCSGFAAVSLVLTLAREKLVERSLIGGMCAAGLGLLGQASQSLSSISGISHQILDPNLVTGVLFAGALVISALVQPSTWTKSGDVRALIKYTRDCIVIALVVNVGGLLALAFWLESYIPLVAIAMEVLIAAIAFAGLRRQIASSIPRVLIRSMYLVLLVAVCTQSYWHGVTASDIKKQVESSDSKQLRMWDDWADEAKWLVESGIGFDKPKVMQRFDQQLDRGTPPRLWMLTTALRAGLISKTELLTYAELQSEREQITAPKFSGQLLNDLRSDYVRIAACHASGDSIGADRDVLIERLMVNWNDIDSNEHVSLGRIKNALLLTELFNMLDPQAHLDQRTADVHRWLVKHQVTKPRWLQDGGGFRLYEQTYSCDRRATLSAISLMEFYGTPPELDIPQLRSYLRPNFLYDFQPYDYVPKTIARNKLNQLATLPQLTVLDYLQSDLPLWLSIMLVFLLSYATLSSSVRKEGVS